jgi:NADH-quinone oxidoreductase subunit N
VLTVLLQQAFDSPNVDFHAFAPELVLTGALVVVLVADLFTPAGSRGVVPQLAGIGILASIVPVLTLALDGDDRVMFDGAYAVDNFALVLKMLFLVAAYVVVLLSTNYIAEGDYAEGEYYFLLLASLLGMTVMASSRDLITIFVALELLSIPAYMLAGWRKRDLHGNEAAVKYYLMGVFASAIMLYGMSLLFGASGSTLLADIGGSIALPDSTPFITLAVVLVVIGFAFKVSAVPFHTWAPDTYEGAPTPITAFLAVLSKTAGFVALLQLILIAFSSRSDVIEPLMWVLSAITMTVGNLIALRQTNIVRMLAYSGVAQAGFMLAPLAVVGSNPEGAGEAVITYLLIYAAMNLGAFAVVLAVARKTRSAEISTWGGLFEYAPGLTVLMTLFLFSLAGIPPLGGWLAKFVVFRSLLQPDLTAGGVTLAVIVGVNSVIALYYYANVAKTMWMDPVPDDDRAPVRVPFSLGAALAISITMTIAFGVSNLATRFGDLALFVPT